MNRFQKKRHSVAARTFRATVLSSVILGAVALLIGLGLYAYALGGQYIGEAFNLTRSARAVLDNVVDLEPLSNEVMDRYYGLSEQLHSMNGSFQYRYKFADLIEREDYKTVLSVCADLLSESDVYDLYIAMYNVEDGEIIYIADPDEDESTRCLPGDWEKTQSKEAARFLSWDGNGKLYAIDNTENYGWLATSGVPLKNAQGETFAFVLADVSLQNLINGMKLFILQFLVAMIIVVNIIAFMTSRRMKKLLVNPINQIAKAADAYAFDRTNGIDSTEHFNNLNITTGDEIENLALTMKNMEKDLTKYEENLASAVAEKERVSAELTLAKRIQAAMLPNIFPPYPERTDFDIFASMTPAKEVGGDFYDFFLIDENHLALVMADVSGKGVPAALFMMISKTLVKNYASSLKSPKAALEAVNNQICSNNSEDMFVTVWLGILDLQTGVLSAANAGHEYPVLKKPDGAFELISDKHGFVIGGMSGIKYKEYEIKLEPDSMLFLYTDGVVEATNAENELFGKDRMLSSLNSSDAQTATQVLCAVAKSVSDFASDAPQFDDITMLCLHYIGSCRDYEEITVDASLDSVPSVTEFIDERLESREASVKAQMQIDVAIDEIFSNIARYAYGEDGGKATVRIEFKDDLTVITFIDSGKPFDPLKREEPDVTLSAEERKAGGLGIFIVKKTMDDVKYEYSNGCNILTVTKKYK